jgi:ABC-type branched-subunit amino acid transport system substrate-binding protein
MLIITILQPVMQHIFPPAMVSDSCSAQMIKVGTYVVSDTKVSQAADGECIGISDGAFSFDVDPLERVPHYAQLKDQVLTKLNAGHVDEARALWQTAGVTNDAEMLIYLEDQRVLQSHYPYINIVLATILTGFEFNLGRDNVQGVYVAQKEINTSCALPRCTQIRILIANSGSGRNSGERATYASDLAALIVQKAASYRIAGVIGWTFSGQSISAVQVLAPAHIPMVSPSASSDSLTGTSYFWRVAAVDSSQAKAVVPYAIQQLQAKKVAVFYDPTDSYSRSLGEAFIRTFESAAHKTVIKEFYTVGKTNTDYMISLLRDALKQAPDLDLIYFSGYADDASPLLDILPTSPTYSDLRVLGGDALYVTGSYRSGSYPPNAYGRLYFTAFAYPDEWIFQHLSPPRFFCEYATAFSSQAACSGPDPFTKYHYTRASSDVILAYDATLAFAQAAKIVLTNNLSFTPDDIQQALAKVQGNQAVQGASGQISLGPDGNPINKAVVILRVDAQGNEILESVQGCFLRGSCSNATS